VRTLAMLLVAALAALVPDPCWALISWVEVDPRGSGTQIGGGEKCWKLTVTTANETDTSEFFFVGGSSITIQSDGDAAGAGTGAADLFAGTNHDGNADGTTDITAFGPLNLVDTDADGVADDNTLDGTAGKRGTLDPIAIGGWIYVDPDAATIDAGETLEVTVCAVR